MKTLSAHKTRSIIEKTIIESLFVKGEGTLSVITALKKLNAVQLSNNTFILYGCKITVSDLRSIEGFTENVTDVKRKKDLIF